MGSVLRSTWPLFVGIVCTVMSYGLQVPLIPLRAFDLGFDTSVTGLIAAGYFLGGLLSAFIAPRLIQHVGHIKVFAALASVASGTPVLYVIFDQPLLWFVLHTATGLCLGGLYIVAETWLNDRCANEIRGRVLSLYFMIVVAGTGVGALLLSLAEPSEATLFILASLLISFGLVPILLSARPAPSYEAPRRLGLLALARKAPLGAGAIAIWGLADGALMGAGPIYADKVGLTTDEVATFMAVISLGCLLFMWPIGMLSDRFDRARFLVALSLLAALAAGLCAITPSDSEPLLYGLTALFAGLTLAHYGLCLAVANDRLEPSEMVSAGATLTICYSVGSILGPVLSTELMELWRPTAFFVFLAGVHVAVVLYGLALMALGAGGGERRQPTAVVTSLAGPLATESALESVRGEASEVP
ncbi:MAG: MFS transporter [Pseudomonadota bacterium]